MAIEDDSKVPFYVSVWFRDIQYDPADISVLLQVEASSLRYKGSRNKELNISEGRYVPRSNMWTWKSDYIEKSNDLQSHLIELLRVFGKKTDDLSRLAAKNRLLITIWVNELACRPVFYFNNDLLVFLHKSGADFQIEIPDS